MTNETSKEKSRIIMIVASASIISVLVTIIISMLFSFWIETPIFSSSFIDPSIFGQYGDALGGVVGTILTFLSVYLIYKTYQSQKEELQATQDALYDQKNDTAIFNMLSTLRQIITEMDGEVTIINPNLRGDEMKQLKGREYFHQVLESIRKNFYYEHIDPKLVYNPITGKLHGYREERTGEFNENGNEGIRRVPIDEPAYSIDDIKDEIGKGFLYEFDKYSYNFDHYFRFFRNVIEFIQGIDFENDKIKYFNMLKSQLSQDELVMIFYFTITTDKEFLNIIDSNKILDPILNPKFVVDVWHHWQFPYTDFKFLSNQELRFKNSFRDKFLNLGSESDNKNQFV